MNYLFRFGLVFVISLAAFGKQPMSLMSYLLITGIIGGVLIAGFRSAGNFKFIRNLEIALVGNLSAYLVSIYVNETSTYQEILENYYTGTGAFLLLLLAWGIFVYHYPVSTKDNDIGKADEELFREHQYDMERLKCYLQQTNVLGINAAWGEGKSFVVDWFCQREDTKDSFYVLKIETLAYKYDEFDKVLISKLDQLLRDHHIFSMKSTGLKNTILGINFGNLIYRFFEGTDAEEASTYETIRGKVQYLDKPVLVIFEDLERADNPVAVKKLFAIVEKMACNHLKFIYEYDAKALDDQEINYDYRNKYIPMEMNLTKIPFGSLVSYFSNSYDSTTYPSIDSDVLKIIKSILFSTYNGPLSQYTKFKMNDYQRFFTARIVQHFLRDVNGQLTDKIKKDRLQLKTLIGFYFIKNFMHVQYDEIRPLTEMEKIFTFTYKEKEWSIGRLCKEIKGCKDGIELATEVMKDPQNRFHYMVLCLLEHGYISNANDNENELKIAKTIDVDTRLLEDRKWMKAFEDRDRINHIVWNLIENGSSEHTNNEAAVKRFVDSVLSIDESGREKAWNQYCKDLFNEDFYKNNSTIFLFGVNPLVSLSRGLNLNNVSDSIWNKFFDFCDWKLGIPEENLCQIKKAPEEAVKKMRRDEMARRCYIIIDLLSYADVRNFDMFLKALKLFLKYVSNDDVSGNFNHDANYRDFLHKYFLQMKYFGLIHVSQLEWSDSFPETMAEDDIFEECIEDALKDIENNKKVCDSRKMILLDEAFDLAATFIRVNRSIIYQKTPMRRPSPISVNISTSSPEEDEEVFYRIRNILPEKQEDLTEEIQNQYVERSESEYRKGNLRPDQLIHLMDKLYDLENRTKNNESGD